MIFFLERKIIKQVVNKLSNIKDRKRTMNESGFFSNRVWEREKWSERDIHSWEDRVINSGIFELQSIVYEWIFQCKTNDHLSLYNKVSLSMIRPNIIKL